MYARRSHAQSSLIFIYRRQSHISSENVFKVEHQGPALVDVTVNRQELAMPPAITLEQIKGFTLYMIKAVLNGKGDEVIDLAKTNLFT